MRQPESPRTRHHFSAAPFALAVKMPCPGSACPPPAWILGRYCFPRFHNWPLYAHASAIPADVPGWPEADPLCSALASSCDADAFLHIPSVISLPACIFARGLLKNARTVTTASCIYFFAAKRQENQAGGLGNAKSQETMGNALPCNVIVKSPCARQPAARMAPGSGLKTMIHCREPEFSRAAGAAQHPAEPAPWAAVPFAYFAYSRVKRREMSPVSVSTRRVRSVRPARVRRLQSPMSVSVSMV